MIINYQTYCFSNFIIIPEFYIFFLSHTNYPGLNAAKKLVENLIQTVSKDILNCFSGLNCHAYPYLSIVRLKKYFLRIATFEFFRCTQPTSSFKCNRRQTRIIKTMEVRTFKMMCKGLEVGEYKSEMTKFCDWYYGMKFIIVCNSLFRKPVCIVYCLSSL